MLKLYKLQNDNYIFITKSNNYEFMRELFFTLTKNENESTLNNSKFLVINERNQNGIEEKTIIF